MTSKKTITVCLLCTLHECDETSKTCPLKNGDREKRNAYMREYSRRRYASDPKFKKMKDDNYKRWAALNKEKRRDYQRELRKRRNSEL